MALIDHARRFASIVFVLSVVVVGSACSGASESSSGDTPSPAATEAIATATGTSQPSATPEPSATSAPPTEVPPTEVPATAAPAPPVVTQPTARPSQSGVPAAIRGYGFPYELRVAAGSTVVWTNYDNVAHDVTASDGSWASPVMGQGATFAHTFNAPGRYGYICKLHPYMTAAVIVQ
ncbi:MAG TPA: plastocyanin/azurin family copper-binding protein [Dehalococcoidia bacterium]|nr:plastocyanin/azurin family copper-binding protein [Dehalococcoidia bacterium]